MTLTVKACIILSPHTAQHRITRMTHNHINKQNYTQFRTTHIQIQTRDKTHTQQHRIQRQTQTSHQQSNDTKFEN